MDAESFELKCWLSVCLRSRHVPRSVGAVVDFEALGVGWACWNLESR